MKFYILLNKTQIDPSVTCISDEYYFLTELVDLKSPLLSASVND